MPISPLFKIQIEQDIGRCESQKSVNGSEALYADLVRACLIIGDMPNGEGFFRQTRQIFAGILSYGKKM